MSAETSIEWTDKTWNPVRGCELVSPGCTNCYAMKLAHRFAGLGKPYEGLTKLGARGPLWTGRARTVPEALTEPLRWRKPQRVFVNSMSDLFHEDVPDEFIAAVFGVMAAAPQHTFQVLTKRPERMARWFEWVARRPGEHEVAALGDCAAHAAQHLRRSYTELMPAVLAEWPPWPLPNVWLGVSVEDQRRADERIPHLLRVPAAVRFLSCEPLLGPVDLRAWMLPKSAGIGCWHGGRLHPWEPGGFCPPSTNGQPGGLHWVIVGGESGPGARPFDLAWARSLVSQCREAAVPVFVKQLGGRPEVQRTSLAGALPLHLRDRKGGDPKEWPEDLRVREFPAGATR